MAVPIVHSTQEFIRQLESLLPRGILWDSIKKSTVIDGLFYALASEANRFSQRMKDLFDETDPRTVLELLDEYQKWAGLPLCGATPSTLQERRQALHAQLTAQGGQSEAYFIALAASLGYSITITTYEAFECGISQCGIGELNEKNFRFIWRVTIAQPRGTWFKTGVSQAGEKLLDIDRAEDLECILRKYKPAHTRLFIAYEGV